MHESFGKKIYPKEHFPVPDAEEGVTNINESEVLGQTEAAELIVTNIENGEYMPVPYFGEDGTLRVKVLDDNDGTIFDADAEHYVKMNQTFGNFINEEELRLEAERNKNT